MHSRSHCRPNLCYLFYLNTTLNTLNPNLKRVRKTSVIAEKLLVGLVLYTPELGVVTEIVFGSRGTFLLLDQ